MPVKLLTNCTKRDVIQDDDQPSVQAQRSGLALCTRFLIQAPATNAMCPKEAASETLDGWTRKSLTLDPGQRHVAQVSETHTASQDTTPHTVRDLVIANGSEKYLPS